MIPSLKKFRCACLVALTHNIALPVLKRVRRIDPFPCSLQQLRLMEEGTVGNDLSRFIHHQHFTLLSHYARHDLKHVVLGYDATEEGELCLQSFMFGNGRVSFPVLATLLFGLCTAPEHWKKMRIAYNKGKSCNPIHHWNWFGLLHEKTATVRARVFIK